MNQRIAIFITSTLLVIMALIVVSHYYLQEEDAPQVGLSLIDTEYVKTIYFGERTEYKIDMENVVKPMGHIHLESGMQVNTPLEDAAEGESSWEKEAISAGVIILLVIILVTIFLWDSHIKNKGRNKHKRETEFRRLKEELERGQIVKEEVKAPPEKDIKPVSDEWISPAEEGLLDERELGEMHLSVPEAAAPPEIPSEEFMPSEPIPVPKEPELPPEEPVTSMVEGLIERKKGLIIEEEYEPISEKGLVDEEDVPLELPPEEAELPPPEPELKEETGKDELMEIDQLIKKVSILKDITIPVEIERKVKEQMENIEEWWKEFDKELKEILEP